ncbi:hypothetical protein BN1110_02291 [bacterium YEK0313]|nr:hypothetical protein BN1110_02291 [bacterium YEK0313]
MTSETLAPSFSIRRPAVAGTLANPRLMTTAGRAMSGLAMAFLTFDTTIKLLKIEPVVTAFAALGYDPAVARPIGVVILVCLVLYAIPRTAVLGAVLTTGLLGGAIASHVRIDSPLLTHTLFSLYLGLLVWGGLWLRDPRLRALFPVRR